MVLKDDRVSLLDYGMQSGARIVAAVLPDPRRQQAQAMHGAQASPAPAAPGQDQAEAKTTSAAQPPLQSVPPGTAPATGTVPEQPAAPPQPEPSPEEKHLQQIGHVQTTVRETLVPELQQFEQTIASLPDAASGAQPVTNDQGELIPTARIPVTQRKLSEYLLRELMKLDGVPVDTDEIRASRKSTVKEIQSYLERVDAAWKRAQECKGIVNDV